MFNTLHVLTELRVSFSLEWREDKLYLVFKKNPCSSCRVLSVNRQVHASADTGKYDPCLATFHFVQDMSSIINTPNFESWEHDFETKTEARKVYRQAKAQGKEFFEIVGKDNLQKVLEAIEKDCESMPDLASFPVSLDGVSLLDLDRESPDQPVVYGWIDMSTLYPHWGKDSWKLLPSETIGIDGEVTLVDEFRGECDYFTVKFSECYVDKIKALHKSPVLS